MSTAGTVESKNDRLVTALLDGIDGIEKLIGTNRNEWRWGSVHTIRFESLVSVWLVNIPGPQDTDFLKGFPRPGDQWGVDASNFGLTKSLSSDLSFSYGSGPVQRFVAEMGPSGPKIKNALPGGAVLGKKSPYFRNEAEYWRKNENHDVPFDIDDVAAAGGGEHVLFTP